MVYINRGITQRYLTEELLKPINRKFEKCKAHSSFKDNIWGANLAYMQLISKYSKVFPFVLCVNVIFSKYTRIIPSNDKKGITITNAFQKS